MREDVHDEKCAIQGSQYADLYTYEEQTVNSQITFKSNKWGGRQHTRRGAAVVVTAVSLVVILGFTALAVDLGYVMCVRGELQVAADAAALAGVSALADSAVIFGSEDASASAAEASSRAIYYAGQNAAEGESVELLDSDVQAGSVDDPNNLQSPLAVGVQPYNAVRVMVRKDEYANGPVNLFFAKIFGKETTDCWAEATAYFDRHVAGYRPDESGGPLIPISVKEQKWQDEIINKTGDDEYGIDPETGEVTFGPDGIPEISIYPEKQHGGDDEGEDGDPDGAGNFGLLNFDNPNNGVPILAEQIRNGLTEESIAAIFPHSVVRFSDDQGNPTTVTIDGNPGLKSSLQDDMESRLDDVIGFFVHREEDGTGANAEFTVVNVQFGRLLYVSAHGSFKHKAIVVQPEIYTGKEIITNGQVPTHATSGRFVLIR